MNNKDNDSIIYLDHNATTPLDCHVIHAISDTLTNQWANPNSVYDYGENAMKIIESARLNLCHMIHCDDPRQMTFTSGGTESNNWVIQLAIESFRELSSQTPHIITTNIEHDSIIKPLKARASMGMNGCECDFVAVSQCNGTVSIDDVFGAIRPQTCLITVMLANNETGVIQPLREIAVKLRKINESREKQKLCRILLHTDAAQAFGKIPVDVNDLCVDYMTIVGHKFYGPRIGALYHRKGSPLKPLFFGGGQENGLRPGTENTPMIAGMGKASELVEQNIETYESHFRSLQLYLESELRANFGDLILINCCESPYGRIPNTTSVAFTDERLISSKILESSTRLRASLGAACHSSSAKEGRPSKVLIASGVSDYLAQRTIRLTTGRDTLKEHIDIVIKDIKTVVETLMQSNNRI